MTLLLRVHVLVYWVKVMEAECGNDLYQKQVTVSAVVTTITYTRSCCLCLCFVCSLS